MPSPGRQRSDAIPAVAFDMTPAISGRTGIARYVEELAYALEREGVQLRRWAVGRASRPPPEGTRWIRTPARLLEPWWRLARRPLLDHLLPGFALVHATGAVIPPTQRPLVVTVHDMAAIRFPALHPPRHLAQQQALLRALAGAAAIVAVSQATADDLVALGVDSERLTVAPLGSTLLPTGTLRAEPQLPAHYLLCVGETSPRKRLELVLHALALLHAPELGLVIAGPPAADEPRLRELISSLGLRERVLRLEHVSDALLSVLYRDAVALCFPSISEGFGLPVLEALAAGLPVVASDIAVLRELAGDAALYPAEAAPRAWAEAVESIVCDERLRSEMVRRGHARAALFTWERTARATLAAYRRASSSA